MRLRIVKGVLALAVCVPTLALAQQQPAAGTDRGGSWELSVGAGGTYLDGQLLTLTGATRVAPGGVVRLGYNFNESWGLSVGTGVGYGKPATVFQPFAAITWTSNLNARTSPFLTLGGGATSLSWTGFRVTSKYGLHAGVGVRHMIGEKTAVRLEVREQYEKFSTAAFASAAYQGIGTLGLSWFLGGGPARDSDGDGVPDKLDQCPDTPSGAIVDARGCPIDSDRDGVPDGLDQCPDTPDGVQADTSGCPLDSDGDGVADYLDRCADTPANARPVDANGCPVDSDGDGVADYLDRCADTPANARPVDANGCPVDSDNDGVADYLDRCPNTPSNARPVNANGCPVDSDGDGVADYLDRCPNTPAGTRVDAAGCPVRAAAPPPPPPPPVVRADTGGAVAPLPAVNATLVLRSVVFRPNSARLPPEALADLDAVAAALRAIPNARWEISGHTSGMGNAAQNQRLSERRAQAVKAYLVGQGVPAASLASAGYGSERPIATNATVAGRRQNMRVEVKRLR